MKSPLLRLGLLLASCAVSMALVLTTHPAFCANCIHHRDGDLCTHPDSPVNKGSYRHYLKGECGPVCAGELRCTHRTPRREACS